MGDYHIILGQFCVRPMNSKCRELQKFVQQNLDWMNEQIKSNNSDYWKLVCWRCHV